MIIHVCANVIEYFPRALLISGYPRMWVQFDGENKTRADITILSLVCTRSSFSLNEHEIYDESSLLYNYCAVAEITDCTLLVH